MSILSIMHRKFRILNSYCDYNGTTGGTESDNRGEWGMRRGGEPTAVNKKFSEKINSVRISVYNRICC